MSKNLMEVIDRINADYEGIFGPFEPDDGNEEDFATALHPIPDNRYTAGNRITFSIESDIESEYQNRVEFIDDKTKPSRMGTPWDLPIKFGFDKEHGRINNFTFSDRKGGYVYFAGCKSDVLFIAELHSQRRHMEDDDLYSLMNVILDALQ